MTHEATPVVDGILGSSGDGPRLLGSRCPICSATYFPRAATCRRPSCSADETEPIELPPTGTIHSYTVQHYPAPAPFDVGEPFEPYAIVLVELPGALRVVGILDGDPDELTIGSNVRLRVAPIRRDADGTPRTTWKFELQEGAR